MNRRRLRFRLLYALTAILWLGVATSSARPDESRKSQLSPSQWALFLYTEGLRNNLMGGDTARSIELFYAALEADSTHAPSMYELSSLVAPHDMAKALQLSKRASTLDSTNTWYRAQLGRLQMTASAYDDAVDTYRRLLAADPSEPDNYRLLTWLYMRKGNNAEALAVLDSADRRLGMLETLVQMRLSILSMTDSTAAALAVAQSLVDNFPDNEDNFVSLGDLYAQMHDDAKAQSAYDRALEINPNSMNAVASLTNFYGQRNDTRFLNTALRLFKMPELPPDRKLQFFKGLIRTPNFYRENYAAMGNLLMALRLTYPNADEVRQLYVQHLMHGGQEEVALNLLESSLRDNADRDLYREIINIEAYLKRPDSAMLYANRAIAAFPKDAELYQLRASLTAFLLDKPKASIIDYKRALSHTRNDSLRSVIYGALGDTYHTLKNDGKCFSAYNKGLKYDSTNIAICNNYSYFLSLRNERLDDALTLSERANRRNPNNPTFMDTYAWVLYQLGRYDEARTIMRQAVALDRENNKELYLHYGDILFKLNEKFMASFYWKKAAEYGYDQKEIDQRLKQVE